jgi:hypothetical protein
MLENTTKLFGAALPAEYIEFQFCQIDNTGTGSSNYYRLCISA